VHVQPGVLAGKTRLQFFSMRACTVSGRAAGVAQLLSHMQDLQQLPHLNLGSTLNEVKQGLPAVTAYSALTASRNLQDLDISNCILPEGAWQHLFPIGVQLPHLQSLNIAGIWHPSDKRAVGSHLVSCCPGLQRMFVNGVAVQRRAAGPSARPDQPTHA
jgi:hypothetical protein